MQNETTTENLPSGFSLSRKTFNNFQFIETLHALGKQPLYIKTAWNVNRILKQAEKYIEEGQVEIRAILDKHVERDEENKVKMTEAGDFVYKDKAAFDADYEVFLLKELHFKSHKIKTDELQDQQAKISAEQVEFLAEILE